VHRKIHTHSRQYFIHIQNGHVLHIRGCNLHLSTLTFLVLFLVAVLLFLFWCAHHPDLIVPACAWKLADVHSAILNNWPLLQGHAEV